MKPLDKNVHFPQKKLALVFKTRFYLYWIGLLMGPFLSAQPLEAWDVLFQNAQGETIPMPLAGGLNSPQLSEADLNNDGIQDLYIFDRAGHKHLTFINEGAEGKSSYTFDPSFTENFPASINWVLLRDFDGDDIVDLFTFPTLQISGIMVYKGYYDNDRLAFRLINFDRPLNVLYFSPVSGSDLPIFVSNIDYPAIDDMDCDGDLDILTFNSTGGYIELFENQSIERGFGLDTLIFILEERCWGGLFESGSSNKVDLAPAMGDCFSPLIGEESISPRHTGSSLLTFDPDKDGDKDLLLGDVSFNELNFLTNSGSCEEAWINMQNPQFPNEEEKVDIPIFPAAFFLDTNNDGKEEVMVAPNVDSGGENREVLWQYEQGGGEGQSTFGLVRKNWLVGDMIDQGENAYPCFVDFNQDGLMDLLIGNGSFYEPLGAKNSKVILYQNIGTAETPAFELADEDIFQLNQFSQASFSFRPAFGDLDGDGDLDAVIGEENGQLFFAKNTAGPDQPMTFSSVQYGYMGIDVGFSSSPQLVDVNEDGLLDLLIGEQSGNINYFQNQGTAGNPFFDADPSVSPNIMAFGGVVAPTDGLAFSGYSSPFLLKSGEEFRLFVGNRIGTIEVYGNIDGNLNGSFPLLQQLPGIDEGAESSIALADIDQDQLLDLVVGNQRGGIGLFKTPFPVDTGISNTGSADADPVQVKMSPNPAKSDLHISLSGEKVTNWRLECFATDGQLLFQKSLTSTTASIPVSALPQGVYFFRIIIDDQLISRKVMILR